MPTTVRRLPHTSPRPWTRVHLLTLALSAFFLAASAYLRWDRIVALFSPPAATSHAHR